jgi:hypothetical protein
MLYTNMSLNILQQGQHEREPGHPTAGDRYLGMLSIEYMNITLLQKAQLFSKD